MLDNRPMARPRQLLLIDVPGLRLADIRNLGPHLVHLRELAAQSAVIVPVAAGSTPARQASIATGLLPQDHGLIHGGIDVKLRAEPFWRRAAVAGLKSAFFGNCPQLALASDVHLRSENRRLVCKPDHLDSWFQQGAPDVDPGADFDTLLAHFALRAMAGGYGFVWVENARLLIARIAQRMGNRADDPARQAMQRLDAFVGTLKAAAGDRVVVLVSSNVHVPAPQGLTPPPDLTAVQDGRILHVDCAADSVAQVAAALAARPGYQRVLHGHQRAELGLDCPEAGAVLAELRPGWGFTGEFIREPRGPVGPDNDPGDLPVLLSRGLNLPKSSIGMCEIAWVLQHVLTGQEFRDEA